MSGWGAPGLKGSVCGIPAHLKGSLCASKKKKEKKVLFHRASKCPVTEGKRCVASHRAEFGPFDIRKTFSLL